MPDAMMPAWLDVTLTVCFVVFTFGVITFFLWLCNREIDQTPVWESTMPGTHDVEEFYPEMPQSFDKAVATLLDECGSLLVRKQRDYGPDNILVNQQLFGFQHFVTRFVDKVMRLRNLLGKGEAANFESLDDTLMDIANYAVIALMLRRGWWELPLEEET